MNMKRYFSLIKCGLGVILMALTLGGTRACMPAETEETPLVKLGAAVKEFVAEADGGVINIPVYSNGPYHLEMITEDNEWLLMTMPDDLNKNGYIRAECDFNTSFKRRVVFVICSDVDTRRDTVTFKQKGMQEAIITMDELSVQARGAGGDSTYVINTNVPFADLKQTITYTDEELTPEEWITGIEVTDSDKTKRQMKISTLKNTNENNPRTALVRFQFTDGWGESVSLAFNVIQRTAKEKIGTTVSMRDLKYEYVVSGQPIDKYIIVEGIVVSNKDGRNCGENEQLTTSSIDYSGDQRTIYLESMDGTQGICLMANSADDNVVNLYDKIQVLLYNTNPVMHSDPERLVISGVKANMIVGQVKGQASDVPTKIKYMKDLTDEDIYTYVQLKDVEIPVRKGSLVPVNEGYTIASNSHRFSKYPRLIRDINGNSMYMLTNTVCLYRNDGDRLPYGSGNISGVIVHERFPRFDWRNAADPAEMELDPTLGRIGTYQIRHQVKEDIWGNMKDDFEDGFSNLLLEYRFWNPDKNRGVCLPTYGKNGYFTHTYQRKYTGTDAKEFTEETFNQHMAPAGSFDYLGPIGNNKNNLFGLHVGNQNGLGIILDRSKEYWSAEMSDLVDNTGARPQWCGPKASSKYCFYNGNDALDIDNINYSGGTGSNRGKGHTASACYLGFSSDYWFDTETGKPYAWLLNFSTAGLSASGLSLQIAALNTSQAFYSPRYWKLEWSTTDNQADSNWKLIAEYTVPDVSVWSNTLYSSSVGAKHMDFPLPSEMMGKENVYIRLIPANDLCSSGIDYAEAHVNESASESHTNTISYIAIRYNK